MATTINNNPRDSESRYERDYYERTDNSGLGVMIGIVIAVVIVVLFFVFGLPYLQNSANTPTTPNTGGTVNNFNTYPPAATTSNDTLYNDTSTTTF